MTRRPATGDDRALCFMVSRNGKPVATVGIAGLGIVTASMTAARTRDIDASGSRFVGRAKAEVYLSVHGSDENNPRADRFLVWVDRRLTGDVQSTLKPGDRVEVQVVKSARPDPPLRTKTMDRLPPQQLRSPLNPTRRTLGDAELWARGVSILLKAWDQDANPAMLTAAQARKLAAALNALAAKVERQRKKRPAPARGDRPRDPRRRGV